LKQKLTIGWSIFVSDDLNGRSAGLFRLHRRSSDVGIENGAIGSSKAGLPAEPYLLAG